MKSRLLGTGRALPGDEVAGSVLDNARLAELMDEVRQRLAIEAPEVEVLPSDPKFPEVRLGILRRRVLDEDLDVRDLAVEAGRRAIADADVDPASIGSVLVSTTSMEGVLPAIACTVQDRLGLAEELAAYDLVIGCNGFLSLLYSADGMVGRDPERPNSLLICTEAMVRVLNAADRATMPVCGDGAGAAVLGLPIDPGGSPVWMATQGSSGERITMKPVPGDHPVYRVRSRGGDLFVEPDREHRLALGMQGPDVFKDMVRLLPPRLDAYAERAGVSLDDIDLFLFHQANARMISSFAERALGKDFARRTPLHIAELGNTSSATVPILLDQVRRDGRLKPGGKALLCAFGAGYSMGMTLVEG
jgi:3-oxoacyl-[acyl-carrier-protein] synthase-3